MIVCVAEKPSVGEYIAKVLGANQRKNGYFEGNGYQVTWTFGHLCALLDPQEYTEQWKAWSLSSLPMIPPRFSGEAFMGELTNRRGYPRRFPGTQRPVGIPTPL